MNFKRAEVTLLSPSFFFFFVNLKMKKPHPKPKKQPTKEGEK